MQQLLRFGASQDIQTGNGKLPIHLAAQYGQDDILMLLVHNGASLKSTSSVGGAGAPFHPTMCVQTISNPPPLPHTPQIGKVPLEYAEKEATKKLIESISCGGVPKPMVSAVVATASHGGAKGVPSSYRRPGAPVMISLHVKSMLPTAKLIQAEIVCGGWGGGG